VEDEPQRFVLWNFGSRVQDRFVVVVVVVVGSCQPPPIACVSIDESFSLRRIIAVVVVVVAPTTIATPPTVSNGGRTNAAAAHAHAHTSTSTSTSTAVGGTTVFELQVHRNDGLRGNVPLFSQASYRRRTSGVGVGNNSKKKNSSSHRDHRWGSQDDRRRYSEQHEQSLFLYRCRCMGRGGGVSVRAGVSSYAWLGVCVCVCVCVCGSFPTTAAAVRTDDARHDTTRHAQFRNQWEWRGMANGAVRHTVQDIDCVLPQHRSIRFDSIQSNHHNRRPCRFVSFRFVSFPMVWYYYSEQCMLFYAMHRTELAPNRCSIVA